LPLAVANTTGIVTHQRGLDLPLAVAAVEDVLQKDLALDLQDVLALALQDVLQGDLALERLELQDVLQGDLQDVLQGDLAQDLLQQDVLQGDLLDVVQGDLLLLHLASSPLRSLQEQLCPIKYGYINLNLEMWQTLKYKTAGTVSNPTPLSPARINVL
jgi:hypothetical protein